MCPNRVEELEARVQELEASVEGLTDELVECKVRLRELEDAVDADLDLAPERLESADKPAEEGAETAEASKPKDPDDGDKAEDSEAEIIVA